MVLYPLPADTEHFSCYYQETHLQLAAKLPGLRGMRYSMNVEALEGDSPYFCIWEGDFRDEQAMLLALQSEEGQAVAADVPKYASGGALILHFEVAG